MANNIIIQDLDNAWNAFKNWLENDAEPFIVALVKSLWAEDSQLAMQALTNALTTFATGVTKDAPGTSAKDLSNQLISAVEGQFAGLAVNMAWQDVLIVVAAIVKQLNPPQVAGNGGSLPGGSTSVGQ